MSLKEQLLKIFRAFFNNHQNSSRLILPSHIRLTETYEYELSVRLHSYEKLQANPTGYVDLIIPDEDWHNLPNQSLEHDTLITIVGYEQTDLDARLNRYVLEGEYFPLHQIFKEALSYPYIDHERSNLPHRIRIPYTPGPPKEAIISLNVLIFDEITVTKHEPIHTFLSELQMGQKDEDFLEKNEILVEKLLEALIEKRGFLSELTVEFDLRLSLPKFSGQDCTGGYPILTYMSLSWPINLPRHQVYLEIEPRSKYSNKYRQDIMFDPQKNSLVWRNITFLPELSHEREAMLSFRLPKMRLKINNPVELQRQWDTNNNIPNNLSDTLSGDILINLPDYLLSGLKFDYSKSYSRLDKAIYLESLTTIQANFTVLAQTIFAQRIFSPYQFLQFPNVMLSDMRLADIMLLLQDMGFYLVRVSFPASFKNLENAQNQEKRIKIRRHLIVAQKSTGGKTMKLWLVVEGIPSGTVREREIPGNEKFSTPLQTGSMVIHMRGEISHEQDSLISTMAEIHDKLKERFRHVNTIE